MNKSLQHLYVYFLTIFLIILGNFIGGKAIAASISYSWDDGTLQGWTSLEPFGGVLGVDLDSGNPGGAMYAVDTVQGGGPLLAKAPNLLSSDLSIYAGIQWQEWVPNRGTATRYPTLIEIFGVDGTKYMSDTTITKTGAWNTKFASFHDPSEWTLVKDSGTASFFDVITNAQGLYISMDTSIIGGDFESMVDNVIVSPVPEPATIYLLLSGLIVLMAFGLKSQLSGSGLNDHQLVL